MKRGVKVDWVELFVPIYYTHSMELECHLYKVVKQFSVPMSPLLIVEWHSIPTFAMLHGFLVSVCYATVPGKVPVFSVLLPKDSAELPVRVATLHALNRSCV